MSQPTKQKPPEEKKQLYIFTQEGCPPCPEYDKMAKEAAPKDVIVREVQLGKSVDLDTLAVALGIQSTPAALYVENRQVKKLITPSGKAEDDRAAIANVEKAGNDIGDRSGTGLQGGCPAKFEVNETGWGAILGPECNTEVEKAAKSLGPGAKKNLSLRVTSNDPRVKELLKRLSENK